MTVYVTADWSRVVREGDPEAAFGVSEADIDRLGLREKVNALEAPPEPEPPKRLPRPADKMIRRHADK
jgi:hypothetical protein